MLALGAGVPVKKLSFFPRNRLSEPGPQTSMKSSRAIFCSGTLFFLTGLVAFATDFTWSSSPSSGDWNTSTNWSPNGIPNQAGDTVSFGTSSQTDVTISANVSIKSVTFNPPADPFSIGLVGTTHMLEFVDGGVTNNSANTQTLTTGGGFGDYFIIFSGTAQAGGSNMVYLTEPEYDPVPHNYLQFIDQASAGDATYICPSPFPGFAGVGDTYLFDDNSTAAHGIFALEDADFVGASVLFSESSTADHASFSIGRNCMVVFYNTATAAHATFDAMPRNDLDFRGSVAFVDNATAANGVYTLEGGKNSNQTGAAATFLSESVGGNGTFTVNGGQVAGGGGASATFIETSSADQATLTATGGVAGGDGGGIYFYDDTLGAMARVVLSGNAKLDLSQHSTTGLSIGSIEGDSGSVFLGARSLSVGANSLKRTFGGIIQDGGVGGGSGGSLNKIGTDTWTLTGASTYTGGTTINAGTLVVNNGTGSGTGAGPVQVSAGTLGGSGIVTGVVTVGTGAFLNPSVGVKNILTLKLQSSLALNSDATYNCNIDFKFGKANQVVAKGVSLNDGPVLALKRVRSGNLAVGKVLTIISNTAATPIVGTFANLADGAVINLSGKNFQASYESGDGNDLTLTVVP